MTLVRPLARSPAAARAGQVAAAALLACTGLARAELPVEQLRTEPLAVIGHTAAASVGALLPRMHLLDRAKQTGARIIVPTGALLGLGLGAAPIRRVIGVTKAFQTRVGAGPFPTEVSGPAELHLRGTGANPWDEFGTTTGRPRRVGW